MHSFSKLCVVVFELVDIPLGIELLVGPLCDQGDDCIQGPWGFGLSMGHALEYNQSTIMLFIVAPNLC